MTSISALFSHRVASAEGRSEDLQDRLFPAEKFVVRNANETRRREFIAGRTCARAALLKLGVAQTAILAGVGRQPIWPTGIVGSISHTEEYVGAVVAKLDEVRGLGFDRERVGDVQEALWPDIVTKHELANLSSIAGGNVWRAVALAFSGKEAFFKYQFPMSGQWVGFHDVEVHIDLEARVFEILPLVDIKDVCSKGFRIEGNYQFRGGHVLTGIEVPV